MGKRCMFLPNRGGYLTPAAVMASNYLTAPIATAVMLMREAGIEEAAARKALEPLARTSIEDTFRLGPAAALTGPMARGDPETVRAHLAALAKRAPGGTFRRRNRRIVARRRTA
jgi:predicted short-subunit dehydrogenase-like oxidoreductase (DUF2520 family)